MDNTHVTQTEVTTYEAPAVVAVTEVGAPLIGSSGPDPVGSGYTDYNRA